MKLKIDSIWGGQGPAPYFVGKSQYLAGIGIDPDMPITDTAKKVSGLIRPTAMSKFSGSEITGAPLWIVPNPKNTNAYVYANDGKVHVVNSSLAMGTALNSGNALSSAAGNGAAYYDNKMLFAKNTDIAALTDVSGSPSLTQTYWTSTLSKTALTNTTYPSIQGVAMPNHVMHRHVDNALYIADVVSNAGVLHKIKTRKTTVEGDTDDGSAYNVLDFPLGYYPTAIETYGTDLAVALIEGTNTSIVQGTASLTFWDTSSDSFTKIIQIEFPDPLITALRNVNGILYVFSGSATGGFRVSRFIGGYTYEEIAYFEDAYPPLPGAVDHYLNRILCGVYTSYPADYGVVMAYGSRKRLLGGGFHTILKSTAGTTPVVTAVKYFEQNQYQGLRPIIGWKDASAFGLDKIGTTYGTSIFYSQLYALGQPSRIKQIFVPLTGGVAANQTITIKLHQDDDSTTTTIATINSTNYANSERNIKIIPTVGSIKNNFFLEFNFSGTALAVVSLPVTIDVELLEGATE